jgi:hypothetical protein
VEGYLENENQSTILEINARKIYDESPEPFISQYNDILQHLTKNKSVLVIYNTFDDQPQPKESEEILGYKFLKPKLPENSSITTSFFSLFRSTSSPSVNNEVTEIEKNVLYIQFQFDILTRKLNW